MRNSNEGKPDLAFVETLARRAGDILRKGYGKRHEIQFKGPIDLVTEIDQQSERMIIAEIRARFPDHQILAEETGTHSGDAVCRWYIDPLDGTVNYAHGVPIFAVSIGFSEAGKMKLGVIYDPLRDECFSAERGVGAWLNGERISCSTASELIQALLVTGFPYDIQTAVPDKLDSYAKFAKAAQAVRRLGSAALDLCYVACGRFDGYWESSLHVWDLAAGILIAAEAGATVTNIDGISDPLQPPCGVLASPAEIHRQMLEVLQR